MTNAYLLYEQDGTAFSGSATLKGVTMNLGYAEWWVTKAEGWMVRSHERMPLLGLGGVPNEEED